MVVDDFYDRLARDVNPSHPPVVDLDSDNDSIATMDEAGTDPSNSGREPTVRSSVQNRHRGDRSPVWLPILVLSESQIRMMWTIPKFG